MLWPSGWLTWTVKRWLRLGMRDEFEEDAFGFVVGFVTGRVQKERRLYIMTAMSWRGLRYRFAGMKVDCCYICSGVFDDFCLGLRPFWHAGVTAKQRDRSMSFP